MSTPLRSRLELELHADRVILHGRALAKDGRMMERRVVITLGPRPRVTLDGRPARWAMWSGAPSRWSCRGDAVFKVARFVEDGLVRERADHPNGAADVWRAPWAVASEAAKAAAARCHAPSRQVAMRFLPHLRWYVYRSLLHDATGRLAQLAKSAPGVLIFAYALREQLGARGRLAAWRLLRGVKEGRRLDPLLDQALELWSAHAQDAGVCPDRRGHHRAWARVAGATGEERARIVAAQRLLIRRASPQVATTLLFLPPPLAFAPEDLPTGVRDVARWFKVMKGTVVTLERPETQHQARLMDLCRFLSKNALLLYRAIPHPAQGALRLARWIAIYASIRDVRLDRRRSPRAFIACFEEDRKRGALERVLHQCLSQPREVGAAQHAGALPSDLRFPLEHQPLYELPCGGVIRALRTPAELYEEGERMQHCVATYVWDALEGRSSFWHASVDGRELTLELRPTLTGPIIGQYQEQHRLGMSMRTVKKLGAWLRRVRAEVGGPRRGCSSRG